MSWKIPLFDTEFGREELDAVAAPVARGWLTMGDETAAVEAEIRERLGVAHCLAVTNGTAALHMACAALGLGPGDEVLCPTLTFVATANAICYTGATPVFCESIGPHDLNVDVDDARRRVSERTRAVLVVHYAGFPGRMDDVMTLAREHDLAVIEDSAHAVFSTHGGKWCGTIGDAGCFSFFSNKNATCGEGGAVVTNRDDLAETLTLLRSHGMTSLTLDRHRGHAFTYDVLLHGYNYRIDEIRAALLRAQLGKLDDGLRRRRDLFARYAGAFEGTDVVVPFVDRTDGPDWPHTAVHILPVLLPNGCDRAGVMQHMKEEAGVQTSIHYRPVHRLSAFAAANASLPRTEALAARELTLPLYPGLRAEDVEYVSRATLRALAGTANAV
ncbi:MAG: DegT/DnrJ/EryC1/StrS family aminotransferase [Planctomycetota bacterium]